MRWPAAIVEKELPPAVLQTLLAQPDGSMLPMAAAALPVAMHVIISRVLVKELLLR